MRFAILDYCSFGNQRLFENQSKCLSQMLVVIHGDCCRTNHFENQMQFESH
jgi:aminoglycoside phosphotransferase